MATITSDMIKDLRERTGAGLMDCKKALTEVDADMEKAVEYLRKKGIAGAAKKAGRIATEGAVTSYIHMNNRVGVLLEVNCETDFVAKTADFQAFCADVAMQIAAMNPVCVRREEMDTSKVESERALLREKALAEGKPEKIVDKIVDGQVGKFYSEHVLLEQKFVKDDKKTIELLQQELVAKLGENIKIRRFTRYELGEGLEKKSEDFAAEVAAQIKA
ncbi:translation elongation factor Ts [Nannocystis pusilla]|jgi:elongation factor Ts|uniref:Elongation factor Ts n=1 Tax=Nannocystis pusilla TaxID=889268 RepID=A0A9X3F5H4_9BACT|nr:translation elongation factor Ts [Nannocystis pusilla]MCY1011958.1 translation elongation factor Ts [Nannocystis pusilla]